MEVAKDGDPSETRAVADDRELTAYEALKDAVSRFLYHPWTELGLLLLILVWVALLIAESSYQGQPAVARMLGIAGDLITWLFVIELSLRLWVARKKRRFFRRYWLDILSVLPVVRPLRLLRVVRLLRLFRAGLLLNRRISAFQGVFRFAGTEFTLLGTVTVILVLAGAVTIFLAENRANPDFRHLESAVWFAVYTLIGGEPIGGTPASELGHVVTLGLMLGGLTVFGMFVGTVSASMAQRLAQRSEVNEMDLDELIDHVVVCGWNHSGPMVVEELFSIDARQAVVIVTEDSRPPADLRRERIRPELLYHVSGDYTRVEVLEEAAIRKATTAILLSDKTVERSDQDRDARTVLAALTIERLAPHIFTCAELRSRENESLLRMAGVEEIVIADEYSGYIMGSVSRNRGLVKTLDEILSIRYGNAFYKADLPPEHVGKTVGELAHLLRTAHEAILVSLERGEGQHFEVKVNPPTEMKVEAGDRLVVIAERPVRW
ncbi:MAG: potassium channel protein [Deltaproteobacteria bacterium]|nr:MAG: potassium channel protein [Deltaproteobacteria bacterium]